MSEVNVDADTLCAEVASALGRPQDPTVTGWGVEDDMQFLMIRTDQGYWTNGLRVLAGLQARLLLTQEQAETQMNALSAARAMLTSLAHDDQLGVLASVKALIDQAQAQISSLLAQQGHGTGQG